MPRLASRGAELSPPGVDAQPGACEAAAGDRPGAPGPVTVGRCEARGGATEGHVPPRRLSLEPAAGSSARLRAIPANVGLRLMSGVVGGCGDDGRHSREVDRYDHFWSYSRHASPILNCITLLIYYHSWLAFLAGVAASTAAALLLPAEVSSAQMSVNGYRAGLPCMAAGLCVFLVVMFSWPSRQRVFLDKACIPQDDETAKRNGILSLAYYLRMSRIVLVLWDTTYFRRLWCVFELAAFLNMHSDREQAPDNALHVLPSFYGGVLAVLFVGQTVFNVAARCLLIGADDLQSMVGVLSPHEILLRVVSFSIIFCIIATPLSPLLARHVCTFAEQEEQLVTFSLEHAGCFCCSSGHQHPETQNAIPCDREMIRDTVIDWFGDVDRFDRFVQEKLLSHSVMHAQIPYRYLVICLGSPILWDMVGRAAWHFRAGQGALAWRLLLQQMSKVFLFNPLFFDVVTRSFAMWCKPGVALARMSVLSILTVTLAYFLMLLSWRFLIHVFDIFGYIILAITYSLAILLVSCGCMVHRRADT